MHNRQITVDGITVDRGQLDDRSQCLASALVASGVKEGDVVAVMLHNRQAYLEIILACRLLGVYYCPINWHFTAPEVQYILEDSGAKVLFTEAGLAPVAVVANIQNLPVICVGAGSKELNNPLNHSKIAAVPTFDGLNDYDTWVGMHEHYSGPPVSPRGHMAYTSGTTGRPKGVVRYPTPMEGLKEQQALLAQIIAGTYGLTPGCRALLPAPIYHSAPSLFCQMALQLCDHFVVTSRFDPLALLEAIERYQIEVIYLVPIMYVRLLKLDPEIKARYNISSLRFVASTGSPCPPDIKKKMIDWFGPIINETYASSEAGLITLATAEDALQKPGTAGKPVPSADVKIMNENGDICESNQVGHIYVRNSAYADFTYRNNPVARQAIERDGLISLGDIGYVDNDGYLFVCDREADMVLSGGVNIYPAEVEHTLLGYPGVADCAVIGLPDAEYGQKLLGIIELSDRSAQPHVEIQTEALIQWLGKHLAKFKIPKTFVFMQTLPRDPNGKISRKKLKSQIMEPGANVH